MPGYLHHVQWSVLHLERTRDKLVREYGMRLVAGRESHGRREVVLQSGTVVFLVSETSDQVLVEDSEGGYPWLSSGREERDSVFNICLEVEDVRQCHDRMTSHGAVSISPPRDLVTREGVLGMAVVSSPCTNVVHSLVSTGQYRGHFLPGFSPLEEAGEGLETSDLLTCIDHGTTLLSRFV